MDGLNASKLRHRHQPSPEHKNILLASLREAALRFPEVAFAYLHGSALDELPFHDLDLGVYLVGEAAQRPTDQALTMGRTLSGIVRVPVDVRALNEAPIPFRYQVIRGRLLFCRDQELHSRFLEHTISRYLDMQPLRRRAIREAFG